MLAIRLLRARLGHGETNEIGADLQHRHFDVVVDHHSLVDLAGQYAHRVAFVWEIVTNKSLFGEEASMLVGILTDERGIGKSWRSEFRPSFKVAK